MSSAATAGPPPPNSHFHNAGGGKPVGVRNGYPKDGDGGRRPDKMFKHIKDILAARPHNIDINAPIRTILSEGEQHAKNADSMYDFRRPDLALEEYLKASIVAVEIIPRHKDYPELQSDRGEIHRLYQGLKKRINSQQDRFDGVKDIIKENNIQHGTQPETYNDHPNPANHHVQAVRAQTNSFDAIGDKGISTSYIAFPRSSGLGNSELATAESPSVDQLRPNTTSIVKRPTVHPKPEALQGRSIKPIDASIKTSSQSVEDLASRFARLRGAETVARDENSSLRPSPIQDPRINTRPIVIPPSAPSSITRPSRPLGPRDIPAAPSKPLKIALGVEIPEMPRPPEAVYSPARNLENNSHSEFPTDHSKAFNNYISRASSMDLGRGVVSVDDSNPYFYAASLEKQASPKGSRLPDLSRLKSVTAQQLQQFMQIGSQSLSILLVDIRNREDFDNGHIMWSSVICIEPISLKEGVSADEIEQRMVISPDTEQQLYIQRNKFSLVVYYDQSTSSPSTSLRHGNKTALQHFHTAVYEYGYEKRLQNKPLLLEGGLDAWIDLVGEGALATSKSLVAAKANGKHAAPLSRPPAVSVPKNEIVMHDTTTGDELYQDSKEIRKNEHLPNGFGAEGEGFVDDFYYRTTEDFMRRFPAPSDIRESMMSPSNQLILASQVPARPQKAMTPGGNQPAHMFSRLNSSTESASSFRTLWGDGHIGLYNQGNLCYMNAAIQALSSIHELRDYLFRGSWVKNKPTKDPPKPPATLDDQQLATKTFSNLLMHLWSAEAVKSSYINPRTFVATINRLNMHHKGMSNRQNLLGGPNQQDSDEFIQFLLQKLHEETSTANVKVPERTDEYRKWLDEQQDISEASIDAYHRMNPESLSTIAKLTAFIYVKDLTCKSCNKQLRQVDDGIAHATIVHFPEQEQSKTFTLHELLLEGRKEDTLDGFVCKYCKKSSVIRKNNMFYVRLPNILVIRLTREKVDYNVGTDVKITTPVVFPEDNMDLADFLVPGKLGRESKQPTKYDCFAVVCHVGNSLRSGHYTAFRRDMVRDGQKWRYKEWWSYNDTATSQSAFSNIPRNQAYILFYRLQGTQKE